MKGLLLAAFTDAYEEAKRIASPYIRTLPDEQALEVSDRLNEYRDITLQFARCLLREELGGKGPQIKAMYDIAAEWCKDNGLPKPTLTEAAALLGSVHEDMAPRERNPFAIRVLFRGVLPDDEIDTMVEREQFEASLANGTYRNASGLLEQGVRRALDKYAGAASPFHSEREFAQALREVLDRASPLKSETEERKPGQA